MLMLQFASFYGGDIGGVLSYWESLGLFSYVLPFLLIFALVFGILTRVKIFKDNKAINGVIALTVGLLALQFSFVPVFFSEIFPRLGVGLALILSALILFGLFLPEEKTNKYVGWGGFILALIVFVVVTSQSFAWTGGTWEWWFYDNWPKILGIGIIIGAIALVWTSTDPPSPPLKVPEFGVPIFRSGK